MAYSFAPFLVSRAGRLLAMSITECVVLVSKATPWTYMHAHSQFRSQLRSCTVTSPTTAHSHEVQ